MSDWENEDLEAEENKEEKKETKNMFNEFDDESEVIPVEVKEKQEQNQKKENEIDYEKKYQERKKKDIAMMQEIEESVKNIKDDELRLKKKLELMQLKQAEKFINEDNDQDKNVKEEQIDLSFDLKTEKDYIKLAQKSVVKINKASKSNKNAYDFILNTIELLLPTLSEDHMQNVTNAIKFLKNKVDKKDKNKKEKVVEKPVVTKSDRFEERKALYKQYGDGDISQNKPDAEDDYNDDGDFM
jgi:hypothetical protein